MKNIKIFKIPLIIVILLGVVFPPNLLIQNKRLVLAEYAEFNEEIYKKYQNQVLLEELGPIKSLEDSLFGQEISGQSEQAQSLILLPEQCSDYGVWDEDTLTCTLVEDLLNENIKITLDNTTLDCDGHTINGPGKVWMGWDASLAIRLMANSVTIKNCMISDFYYGIYSSVSQGHILNNNISNTKRAVLLDNSSSNLIANNTLSNNDNEAIHIWDSSSNLIKNNEIINNSVGIKDWCCKNTFSNNIIDSNLTTGIYLRAWPGGWSWGYQIDNNNISNNNYGIYIANVMDSSVLNNNISLNRYGVYLQGIYGGYYMDWKSWRIGIRDNYISSNSDYGLFLGDLTESNGTYHNNLVNNLNQAYNEGSNNYFNSRHPDGGNYWSDYTGADNNRDGIGDIPYIFSNGQDNYPFIRENGWERPLIPEEILTAENEFYEDAKENIEKIDNEYLEIAGHAILGLTQEAFINALGSFAKIKIFNNIENEAFKELLSEVLEMVIDKELNVLVDELLDEKLVIDNVRFSEFINNKHNEFIETEPILFPELDLDEIANDIYGKQQAVNSLSKPIENIRGGYQAVEDAQARMEKVSWGLYAAGGVLLFVSVFTGGTLLPIMALALIGAGAAIGKVDLGMDTSQAIWISSLFATVYKSELNITKIFDRELDRVVMALETGELISSKGELLSAIVPDIVRLGDKAPFSASFKNTGEIDTEVNLLLEIEDPDSYKISYRSENKSVGADEEKELSTEVYFPNPLCRGTDGFYLAYFYAQHGIFPDEIRENITDRISKLFEVRAPWVCFWKHIPFVAAGKSEATITIFLKNNTDVLIEGISVTDEVPKELAASIDDIEFITPYTEIIEPDPIVKWVVGLLPGETKEIEYKVEVPSLETGEPIDVPGVSVSYSDPETGEQIEQRSEDIATAASGAAVSIEEINAPSIVDLNQEFNLIAYIKNRGGSIAEDVSAIITLPEELELVSENSLIELGNSAGEETKEAEWIIKGREEGDFVIEVELVSSNAGNDFTYIPVAILKSPRVIKQEVVEDLKNAKTGNRRIDWDIDRAIRHINESLRDELWEDNFHLDAGRGERVFWEEKTAAGIINELERKGIEGMNDLINKLIIADKILAEIALKQAEEISLENQRSQDRYVSEAEKWLKKAESENNPEDKIKYWEKSWEYSQKAIRQLDRARAR